MTQRHHAPSQCALVLGEARGVLPLHKHADDAQKADVLVLQCGGEAGQHILSVKKANIHATYDSLKQSLLTRYGGQTHTWQNKLMTLRQSLGQPVASYAGQFRNHLLGAGLAGNDPMAQSVEPRYPVDVCRTTSRIMPTATNGYNKLSLPSRQPTLQRSKTSPRSIASWHPSTSTANHFAPIARVSWY